MNKSEFNLIVESGNYNLAGAYAILMDNAEYILLKSFEDVACLARRVKVAEELIKSEEESYWKKKIEDRIKWNKSIIRSAVEVRKLEYASVLTAERAEYKNNIEFYIRVVKAMESEYKYDNLYEWIFAIDKMGIEAD